MHFQKRFLSQPNQLKLTLLDQNNNFVAELAPPFASLESFHPQPGYTIHCTDLQPSPFLLLTTTEDPESLAASLNIALESLKSILISPVV